MPYPQIEFTSSWTNYGLPTPVQNSTTHLSKCSLYLILRTGISFLVAVSPYQEALTFSQRSIFNIITVHLLTSLGIETSSHVDAHVMHKLWIIFFASSTTYCHHVHSQDEYACPSTAWLFPKTTLLSLFSQSFVFVVLIWPRRYWGSTWIFLLSHPVKIFMQLKIIPRMMSSIL